MGIPAPVRTPALDSVTESWSTAQDTFLDQVAPLFRRIPWDPNMVLPAAALVMAVAMLMLRR